LSSGGPAASAYARMESGAAGGVHMILLQKGSRHVLGVQSAAPLLELGACYSAVVFHDADADAFSIQLATDAAAPPRPPAPSGGARSPGADVRQARARSRCRCG
jgi:hypothetical protein